MDVATIMKIKLITSLLLLIMVGGSALFIAAKTVRPELAPEIQEALKQTPTPVQEVSTPSDTLKNPSTGTTGGNLTPVVTPSDGPVSIDCDLTLWGGPRVQTDEDGCRAQIRTMLLNQAQNKTGVHCSETSAGCGSQDAGQSGMINLAPPTIGGSVDLHIDSPDYQKAIDDFNKSVKLTPIPTKCVPVGDGFNCL